MLPMTILITVLEPLCILNLEVLEPSLIQGMLFSQYLKIHPRTSIEVLEPSLIEVIFLNLQVLEPTLILRMFLSHRVSLTLSFLSHLRLK